MQLIDCNIVQLFGCANNYFAEGINPIEMSSLQEKELEYNPGINIQNHGYNRSLLQLRVLDQCTFCADKSTKNSRL